MTLSNEQATADQVLSLADQLSNSGSQPQQQDDGNGQGEDARIPYSRFKEVNDDRKQLQEQNSKLMELMQNYQSLAQNTQQNTASKNPVVQQPVNQPLFTEEELNAFESDIVLDPKNTLQKFGEAILNRGVETRVKSLEQTFEQKLAQMQSQMAAQTLPTVIENFKRSRFSPHESAEIAAFDNALQGIDPAQLSNPQTLENIRLAAIGYVADQKRSQTQTNQQALFSESPGSLSPGWGGIGQQAQPQIPQEMLTIAQRMGVDPKEAASLYTAMNTSGVFR